MKRARRAGRQAIDAAEDVAPVRSAAASLPAPETLVALARARLARELRALPSPAARGEAFVRLAQEDGALSFGALVHLIREAARAGRRDETQALFVTLLRRIEGLNRNWIARTLAPLRAQARERDEHVAELAQEVTLALWRLVGLGADEKWELFFQRALAYTQAHVAQAYLQRQGIRSDPRATQPTRGTALSLSLPPATEQDGAGPDALPAPSIEMHDASADEAFLQAELADLRDLVTLLPERERLAVTLRFWERASEAEIAAALGLTTRAVRNILGRAYRRLRTWYTDEAGERTALEEVTDERRR